MDKKYGVMFVIYMQGEEKHLLTTAKIRSEQPITKDTIDKFIEDHKKEIQDNVGEEKIEIDFYMDNID